MSAALVICFLAEWGRGNFGVPGEPPVMTRAIQRNAAAQTGGCHLGSVLRQLLQSCHDYAGAATEALALKTVRTADNDTAGPSV